MMRSTGLATSIGMVSIALLLGAEHGEAQDIVVAYNFEELGADTVRDVSDNGNDGTLFGEPQQADGLFGKALAFDGTDDYIDLGDNKFLFTEMTVMFWANGIGTQPNSWPTYFTIREVDGSAAGVYWDKVSREIRPFALKPGLIGEENLSDNATQIVNDAKWHQIAAVFSATSARKLYIDGTLAAEDSLYIGTPADLETTNTYIAPGRTHNAGEHATGIVDEFVLTNSELTIAEISRHRQDGVDGALALATPVSPSGKIATMWGAVRNAY